MSGCGSAPASTTAPDASAPDPVDDVPAGDVAAPDAPAPDAPPPIAATNCDSRCISKMSFCGFPPDLAGQGCTLLCDFQVSEEQLGCVETTSCGDIQNAVVAGVPLCGIGEEG